MVTALKATLAAMFAWLIARHLIGHQDPYFAPISALVAVQATVVRSLREGARFAACFALGVLIAVTSAHFLSSGLFSLGITLLAGTLLGGWARFGAQGIEVPFTATFVLLLGGAHLEHFVVSRLVDVAVGVPVGIAVNAFLVAPLHLSSAADALDRTAGGIADLLGDMADGITSDWPVKDPRWYERSQSLDKALRDILETMAHAHESLRLNPWHGRTRPATADVRGSVQSIAHSLSDALAHAADRPDASSWLDEGFRVEYAELLRRVSVVIGQRLCPAPTSQPGTDKPQQALSELREEIYTRPDGSRAPWYTQSHLLIELNRVLNKVCGTLNAIERRPATAWPASTGVRNGQLT